MRAQRIGAIVSVAFLARAVPVQAQPRRNEATFALNDAIVAMREGHPLLAGARASIEAARHDVTTSGLWTNPQLNVNYMRSFGFTTFDPLVGAAQVGVTQFLELSDVPGARRESARHEYRAVSSEAIWIERDLAYGVWGAIVDLAAAIERKRVLATHLAAIERGAAVVRARVGAGAAPDYEALRVTLAVGDASSRVAIAEAEIAAARGALAIAVGPRAERLRGVPDFDVFARPDVAPLATWLDAIASRPDVIALEQRTEAARSRIDVARRAVFPGLALYAGVAVGQGYGNNGERQVDGIVSVTLPLPVVDRGQGTVPASEARAMSSRHEHDAATIRATQEVRSTYEQVARQRAAFDAYRAAVAGAADRMLGELEAAYREGRITVYALVDAYEAARDARLRAVELAQGVSRAEVALWRAAGRAAGQ